MYLFVPNSFSAGSAPCSDWLHIALELGRPQECTAGGKERVAGLGWAALGWLKLVVEGQTWFSIPLLSLSAADSLIPLLFLVGSCFFPEFWVLVFHQAAAGRGDLDSEIKNLIKDGRVDWGAGVSAASWIT